jgi:hypothetical protein
MLTNYQRGSIFGAVIVAIVFAASLSMTPQSQEIQGTPSKQSATNIGSDRPEGKSFWNRIINDPMNMLTLGLLIVGGGQALLFLWQLRLIRAGLADTKEAADGAKKSADISSEYLLLSKRTAERQLRAYIGVKTASVVSHDEGNNFEVEVELINAGQTPAHHVSHHMSTGLQVVRAPPPDFKTSERGRGEVPVSPGETFSQETDCNWGR